MTLPRRDFLNLSGLAIAGAALGPVALAHAWQQPAGAPAAAPVVPVFTAIRRNVGFFTGRGGTIGYLIAPTGVVVIDSQFPDSAALCLTGVHERSNKRPIDMLINTHHHGDHTGGNLVFKDATKRVVAHATAAAHMKQPPGRPAPTAENYYPTETFTETWRATVGDEVVRARHYGVAHSGGDAVITFERANVAHMGDLMFNGRHPVVDRPAGASLRNWISVLEKTTADHAADTVYIFGHGGTNMPVSGARADLMRFRDYLTALLDHVRAEMKAGKTKEQIAAGTGLLKGFEGHGPLNAAVQNAAYDELAAG
jgi:glyoxylase-like metal-dependent hydrolase (beta-lactamase superfamily II)